MAKTDYAKPKLEGVTNVHGAPSLENAGLKLSNLIPFISNLAPGLNVENYLHEVNQIYLTVKFVAIDSEV